MLLSLREQKESLHVYNLKQQFHYIFLLKERHANIKITSKPHFSNTLNSVS